MKRNYNFSKLIRVMSKILIVILLLNCTFIYYAMNKSFDNALSSLSNFLDAEIRDLQKSLTNIEDMITREIIYNTHFDTLLFEDEKSLKGLAAKKSIKNSIVNFNYSYLYASNYIVYYPEQDIIINSCDTSEQYDLYREVEEDLIKYIEEEQYRIRKWEINNFSDRNYITHVMYNNGKYIVCYIDIQEIFRLLDKPIYGENYYIITSDKESDTYYYQESFSVEETQSIKEVLYKKPKLIDRHLTIKNEQLDFMDVFIITNDYINKVGIYKESLILLILLIASIGLSIYFLTFVYYAIVKPIETFNKNINKLKTDDIYDVKTHYQINELGNASQLMTEMVAKIKSLKIDIYEKTLEQQKAKMDFLTIQIEPHFYLNCLNIIYNMTEIEEYGEVQRMCSCVSDYLRYIFRSREKLVLVQQEVQHINKYLEIQKIRYNDGFDVYINIEENVLEATLPPLILQTFVENAIKHTLTLDDNIELFITGKIAKENEKEIVTILIEDTGEGFDEEILYKLQNGIDISEGENRIGIMNAISRLKLLFKEDVMIEFSNRKSGGAAVKLTFPYIKEG